MVSVFVSPQRVQVKVFTPVSASVAGFVTLPSSQLWPRAGISRVKVLPQPASGQTLVSEPGSVQVGSFSLVHSLK